MCPIIHFRFIPFMSDLLSQYLTWGNVSKNNDYLCAMPMKKNPAHQQKSV